jgi:hypothetical protein
LISDTGRRRAKALDEDLGVTLITGYPEIRGAVVTEVFFGILVGFVLGAIFYEWWHNSGLKMVLSARRMLVAIDTEHNTREIAEPLRRSQALKG